MNVFDAIFQVHVTALNKAKTAIKPLQIQLRAYFDGSRLKQVPADFDGFRHHRFSKALTSYKRSVSHASNRSPVVIYDVFGDETATGSKLFVVVTKQVKALFVYAVNVQKHTVLFYDKDGAPQL